MHKNLKVLSSVFNLGNGIGGSTRHSLYLQNVATNNTLAGLYIVGDRNMIDDNVINANTCGGLVIAPGANSNNYGRNTARFNDFTACGTAPTCGVAPVEICPAPYGGGTTPLNLCIDAPGNTSLCDNMMPGPPRS